MGHRIAATMLALAASACTSTRPDGVAAQPRAYVVAEIQVTDPVGYKEYLAGISPIVARFGGNYLVRGGPARSLEGSEPAGRVVIIEFPSIAAAKAFEDDPESVRVKGIRHRTATSRVFVVEGPQQEGPKP